jgi:hypothetical protein
MSLSGHRVPFEQPTVNALNSSVSNQSLFRRSDEPTPDEIHIERFSEVSRQAIDARFALSGDISPGFGGSEV